MTTQYDDNEPDPSKFFKWTVEIEINEIWVADGFEVTADGIKEMIQEAIGFSYEHETRVRVIQAPAINEIRKAQGYESVTTTSGYRSGNSVRTAQAEDRKRQEGRITRRKRGEEKMVGPTCPDCNDAAHESGQCKRCNCGEAEISHSDATNTDQTKVVTWQRFENGEVSTAKVTHIKPRSTGE